LLIRVILPSTLETLGGEYGTGEKFDIAEEFSGLDFHHGVASCAGSKRKRLPALYRLPVPK
jgi:hypothetical protein